MKSSVHVVSGALCSTGPRDSFEESLESVTVPIVGLLPKVKLPRAARRLLDLYVCGRSFV